MNQSHKPDLLTLPSVFFNEAGIIVDGTKFNIADYPYLVDPYDMYVLPDPPQHVAIEKGAQMGWTIWAILTSIHGAATIYDRNVLYFFPTLSDVTKFSQERLNPMIQSNDILGRLVGNIDSALLKSILKPDGRINHIDMRGMKSASALKSVPSDLNVHDESDEMSSMRIARSRARLEGGKFKRTITLSTPTTVDWGIDQQVPRGSYDHWQIKCQGCGEYTCLELEFPGCFHRVKDDVIMVCKKCEHQIYTRDGMWVSANPSITNLRTFYIAQPNSPTVTAKEILDEHELGVDTSGHPVDVTEFYNQRLARGHAVSDDKLSEEDVYACCGREQRVSRHKGPSALGVDIMKGKYHWIVGTKPDQKSVAILNFGIAETLTEVQMRAEALGVRVGCFDYMPDVNQIMQFCDEVHWAWRVRLDPRAVMNVNWDWRNHKMVSVPRNDAMGESHMLVRDKRLVLPMRDSYLEKFLALPFTKMARVTTADEEEQIPKTRWVVTGDKDNDMRMAFAHLVVACAHLETLDAARIVSTQPTSGDYDPFDYVGEEVGYGA